MGDSLNFILLLTSKLILCASPCDLTEQELNYAPWIASDLLWGETAFVCRNDAHSKRALT